MPLRGYTEMFKNILSNPNITLELGTDFSQIKDHVLYKRLIFTGPIDEYFDLCFGKLPYRSLRFDHQTLTVNGSNQWLS